MQNKPRSIRDVSEKNKGQILTCVGFDLLVLLLLAV